MLSGHWASSAWQTPCLALKIQELKTVLALKELTVYWAAFLTFPLDCELLEGRHFCPTEKSVSFRVHPGLSFQLCSFYSVHFSSLIWKLGPLVPASLRCGKIQWEKDGVHWMLQEFLSMWLSITVPGAWWSFHISLLPSQFKASGLGGFQPGICS